MPVERVEVASVALPLLRVLVPSEVAPLKNSTVPVAAEGETVAVKVTVCPLFDGFGLEARVVVVLVLPDVFTVWVSVEDVLVV